MLDNFKTFPVSQDETLEDTFKYLKDTESLETFDGALKRWKTGNLPLTDEDLFFKKEEITRPKDVPSTHTWWY
jgi:hypothetical protein